MAPAILKKTISMCAVSRFAKIPKEALLRLFDHESEEVRKIAAVRAVQALSAKRINSILRDYVGAISIATTTLFIGWTWARRCLATMREGWHAWSPAREPDLPPLSSNSLC